MSERRLNNTIFLMFLVTENYKKKYGLSAHEFLELDKKYAILNYVSECPDIFDSMSAQEMVEEVEQYVSEA
ncbi:MAG: DUF3791 domain-containing protein [Eubacteriales bacterium]|nr:DUF3791 domain-containing protein [Eubacteriales bacterium]